MVLLIGEHHDNHPIHPGAVVPTTRTLTRRAPVGQAQGHHLDIAEAPAVGQVVQGHPAGAVSFYQRTI